VYARRDHGTDKRVEEVVGASALGRRAVHYRRRKTRFDQQPPT